MVMVSYPNERCGLHPGKKLPLICDLIGPWKLKVNDQQVEFNALTCIDTVSNLSKLILVDNNTVNCICDKFMQSWLY